MINIKKLQPDDFLIAQKLFTQWQIEDGIKNIADTSEEYIRKLLSKDDFHVIAALENDIVIGGLTAYELPMYTEEVTEMYIYELGVDDNHRRQGIATKLLEVLKNICKSRNIKIIFVGADKINDEGVGFYIATGGKGEDVIEFTYTLTY